MDLSIFKPSYIVDKDSWGDTFMNYFWRDRYPGEAEYVKYTDEEGNTVYEFEVPGFNKDNLEVSISEGFLFIKGQRASRRNSLRERSVDMKMAVPSYDIDAEIKDGILYLTVKKPQSKKEVITIK